MAAIKRTLNLLLVLGLTFFGAAFAQEAEEAAEAPEGAQETRIVEIQGEDVAPLGEIQVGETRPYEETETQSVEVEVETGAIIISTATTGDQSPNIDLVGPSGFYEHFEVSADDQGEHIVGGLLPGVYSIAATDDGLQVGHTLVEVVGGQATTVDITLEELAAYEEGTFEAGAETAYPDNAFEAEDEQALEDVEFGEVTVETENDNTLFVMTGPNGYSQEFEGAFTASELAPGVYVIAGTLDDTYVLEGTLGGAEIATSAIEVSVSQAVTFVPVYDFAGAEVEEVEAETEDVEDVAGGGEAEVETDEVETPEDAEHSETEEEPVEEEPLEEEAVEEEPLEEEPVEEEPLEEEPVEEEPLEEEPLEEEPVEEEPVEEEAL